MKGFTALVLAGSRGGIDPVADYAGVSQKGLIRLEGRTLLERVVSALRDAGASRIAVSTADPTLMAECARLECEPLAPEAGPSQSVRSAAEVLATPLLVTTVDHALLQGAWVRQFLMDAPAEADVCALVAARSVVETDAPATKRTYMRLADGDFSGCNLFWLANDRALAVVDLWRRVEAERKRPWKIAAMLGPGLLIRYALGGLTLTEAGKALGRLAGVSAAVVRSPYGLAAVDVDKPADLDLVRRIVGEDD